MVYLKAISNAKHSILIQTPYFLPTESLLKALQSAALANIKVRIMIPRNSDSKILKYASYSYITECLKSGIKFHLYDAGMLHSKTIIIDDELSSVGSTNFDFRSFEHNFECSLFIYSHKTNAQMREIFNDDLKHCTTLNINTWRKRPILQKALESITRLLSPIV
jgi:cardiolipin synthase